MIALELFNQVLVRLTAAGFAQEDIDWAESIAPPTSAEEFALEAIFVICNSGMQNVVARGIFDRVLRALREGRPVSTAFGHPGKGAAIEHIWREREQLLAGYHAADDKLAFCAALPWIGPITKYHLAKNFGADVVKPDVHLQRLAAAHETTPDALCADLAEKTGYRKATIDTLLWRACANRILDGHTGALLPPRPAGRV